MMKTYTLVGMPDTSPIEETIAICLRISKNTNANTYQWNSLSLTSTFSNTFYTVFVDSELWYI